MKYKEICHQEFDSQGDVATIYWWHFRPEKSPPLQNWNTHSHTPQKPHVLLGRGFGSNLTL